MAMDWKRYTQSFLEINSGELSTLNTSNYHDRDSRGSQLIGLEVLE